MSEPENLGSFFSENKDLLKEYIEARQEILRLSAIQMLAKTAGNLVWIIISLFLLFLILLFAGLMIGFWLSDLTHSRIIGFGLTTLILLIIFSAMAIFRKKWFINPVIQIIINRSTEDLEDEEEEKEEEITGNNP
jgi:hypothetical protein